MVVVGSQKMLVFDDMEATEKIRIYDKGATVDGVAPAVHVRHGDIHLPHVPQAEPLKLEAQHFVDCILNDTTPLSDGHDGLRVVRILEMVDRQLRQ
jgi:predicted dehydrogenase